MSRFRPALFASLGGCLALLLSPIPLLAGELPRLLDPAKAITRDLRAGEAHTYTLSLEAGARLRITALQKGVDLVLTAFGPEGKKLAEVDGPTGSYGPETLTLNAATAGSYTYRVTVNPISGLGGEAGLLFTDRGRFVPGFWEELDSWVKIRAHRP